MSVLYSLAARLFAYCDVQTALVLVSVLLLTFWYLRPKKNLPPGPWGWPVLGHIPALGKNPHLGLTAMRKRYGDVIHIRMGPKDVVALCGYEAIHEALVKKGEDFSSRPYLYIFDKMGSFENGLGFLPYGSFWKQQRKFTLRSLRDFGFGKRSLEGKILEEAEGLKEEILQTANAPFNARPLLQNAVSNVICSIVFGSRFEYSDPKFQYLMERINQNFGEQELAGPANFFPWLRHIPAVKKAVDKVVKNAKDVIGTLREFLIEHKNTFDPSNIRDFIDSYLLEMDQEDEAGNRESFTEDQLNYVISDLFVAGSETTSTTLSWALLYMVLYPEVQQKVQQEIDSVVGRDTVLSIIHRSQLPYTEAVITEIMRIKPVAPLGLPRATSNDTNLFGYDIPEGTMVWPVLWSVLYDPVHYPEPDVFKPHRFLNENGQFVKDPTFIPFSTGRRICLGENLAKMELSLFFAHLLQHFTFKLPEGAAKPTTVGIMGIITYSPVSYELCAIPREYLTKLCTKMSVLYSLAARLFAYCDVQTALVLVSVLLLTFWYLKPRKNLPPGPWGWPVLGHIPALGKPKPNVVGRGNILSITHRSQLPYTEAVISEIMRISPISPLGLSRATSNDANLFGYDIPEGTMVWPVLWSVLHDPVHYPEPDVFRPHRFLNENGQFVKDPTFIPFSTGRRICLGENLAKMELFLFFAHLLQHFTFKLPEGAAEPTTVGIMGILPYSPVSYELCAIPRE
ncbi:cytochrome P450 2J4-like [Branchiostoma lanceolatum]|uniref:cytochrome P450 2J4-like n=1 Tax=Branchiostoma lanceolatum TaxID=7740 RepID=UPI003455A050